MIAIERPLPARYRESWRKDFEALLIPALASNVRVLDVGSGRKPALESARRSRSCHYVGLDLSAKELAEAPPGSYDEVWVSDLVRREPALVGQFDLVVSWQVLEHVKPLPAAIENIRSYLVPGGRFVAALSGSNSAFAIANRLIPDRVGAWLMERFLNRNPETVFHAHYDRCSRSGLDTVLRGWKSVEIVPVFCGASYFNFFPPLRSLYLMYENWAERGKHENLATHYILYAIK